MCWRALSCVDAQAERDFEERLREEVQAARAEEKRRHDGSWHAHLTRVLQERAGKPLINDVIDKAVAAAKEVKSPTAQAPAAPASAAPATPGTKDKPSAAPIAIDPSSIDLDVNGHKDSAAAPAKEVKTTTPTKTSLWRTPKKAMSALQKKQAAELAEWENSAQRAKEREANEIADWIEAARAAKAKEAAEIEEWRRKAAEAKKRQGIR